MVIKTLDPDLYPDPDSLENAESGTTTLVETNRFWGTDCKGDRMSNEFCANFTK
jgi:hypothetical protein